MESLVSHNSFGTVDFPFHLPRSLRIMVKCLHGDEVGVISLVCIAKTLMMALSFSPQRLLKQNLLKVRL